MSAASLLPWTETISVSGSRSGSGGTLQFVAMGPPAVWWGLFGLVGTTGILCFAHLSQSFDPALAGYFGSADHFAAMDVAVGIIAANATRKIAAGTLLFVTKTEGEFSEVNYIGKYRLAEV